MKTLQSHSSIVIGCLFLLQSSLIQAEEPIFRTRTLIGTNYFIALSPNTTNWVSLEISDDLLHWTSLVSVAATNSSTLIFDPAGLTAPLRFYRLRQPGQSVLEAENRWQTTANQNYQFNLEHIRYHIPNALPGMKLNATVKVMNGQKAISNIQIQGETVENVQDTDFPTVTEWYHILKQAQQEGRLQVAVRYDPIDGHPTWGVIQRLTKDPIGNEVISFQITDMTYLPNNVESQEN